MNFSLILRSFACFHCFHLACTYSPSRICCSACILTRSVFMGVQNLWESESSGMKFTDSNVSWVLIDNWELTVNWLWVKGGLLLSTILCMYRCQKMAREQWIPMRETIFLERAQSPALPVASSLLTASMHTVSQVPHSVSVLYSIYKFDLGPPVCHHQNFIAGIQWTLYWAVSHKVYRRRFLSVKGTPQNRAEPFSSVATLCSFALKQSLSGSVPHGHGLWH